MNINDKNETIKYLFELKDITGSEISYKRVVGYSWEIKESNKIEITEEINKKTGKQYKDLKEYIVEKTKKEVMKDIKNIFLKQKQLKMK